MSITHHHTNAIHEAIAPYVPPIDPVAPIIDFDKSRGAIMWDLRVDQPIIDFASHYASLPLGYNHPGFFDPEFEKELLLVSRIKIANLDVLSEPYVRFLDKFRSFTHVPGFDKYFFIDGGGLAVENALKTAFDWKKHRNIRLGKEERGNDLIHFREAFHGRTGYTLSITNTQDPNKTKMFPKFTTWPRVMNPKIRFPMTGANLEATLEDERAAVHELRMIFEERADDIAGILIEPIQGEGGDNHFRPEFLQALRDLCDEFDALLIFDEVQTGFGMTGKVWAHQHHGVTPDMICFAKKAQVGGFLAGAKVMEEEKNCFTIPSRISSTWGATLTDMVRCRRQIEIIEEENLLENAAKMGGELTCKGLVGVAERTELIDNVRGSGLFIAFDLVHPGTRASVLEKMYDNGLMCLPCGDKSIRFRPHLNVTQDIVDQAIEITEKSLKEVPVPVSAGT